MKSIFLAALVTVLAGCQHFVVEDINSVDVSKFAPACVRGCAGTYSQCISSAFGAAAQNSCAGGYKICVKTCPEK